MNVNTAHIAGRITKQPELKALPSGMKVCEFSIATNYTYKSADGAKKEEVEFHNCVAFGKTGEVIAQYVQKGQILYVEGRIKTSTWERKEGGKGSKTQIIINNFQFGEKARGATTVKATDEDEGRDDYADLGSDDAANDADIPF